jgi:hypothetical protein
VAFHETFWVVTGTAAPVIALAAVVSLGDAFGQSLKSDEAMSAVVGDAVPLDRRLGELIRQRPEILDRLSRYGRFVQLAQAAGRWSMALLLSNVVIQSALLALSLVSIDNHANAVPPGVAVVAAVLGVTILAVVAGLLIVVKTLFIHLRQQVAADKLSEGPGDSSAQPSQG